MYAEEENVEEKITSPEEGAQFPTYESVTLSVTGENSTVYHITLYRFTGGTSAMDKFNITTTSTGSYSKVYPAGNLISGSDIVQLRKGANNDSGPTLDTITFGIYE